VPPNPPHNCAPVVTRKDPMKFEIKHRWTNAILFECEGDSLKKAFKTALAAGAGANLAGANLAGAYLAGANLADANLRGAIGLALGR